MDCRLGLETEFAAIHDILRPEPALAGLSNKDKAGWVRFEFSQSAHRPRRLLILDNAEDEESVLEWLPKTGNCHALITSRFTGWSSGIETYSVWVLDPGPARELLLRRSGRADTREEREACDALAQKLEYLPLALEQAAAYVGAQPLGWGFADYLRLYEENERAFLMEKTSGATEYPSSVYLTWRATMDKLPQGARAILRMHAFLATSPTPVAMFIRGVDGVTAEGKLLAGETGTPADEDLEGTGEFSVRKWISSLTKYSMAQLQPDDSFSVHALVHAVEWHALGEKRARVLERTTDLFLAYAERPSWEPRSRRMWDVLLPHATLLKESEPKQGPALRIALLDHTWRAYDERGDYRAAIPPARQCLALHELELGPEHPDTLASVNNLAHLLQATGDYAAAEPLYRRALEARERVLGSEHRGTLTSVNNLATLLQDRGNDAAAEPLYRRALEAGERVLGPEHPDTLASVNNLAHLLQATGDYAAAEPLYRRALEARERVLGAEHPETLNSVNNLASVVDCKGDYAAAEPLYRRALEAMERVLGPEHPETLTSVNNLALLLESKGDYAVAEPLFRRALEARERVLGPEHPATLNSVNSLAQLLQVRGDYAAAEPLDRRTLEARERVLGAEHPETLASVNNLADLLYRRGDYAAAEPLFRRALEAMERVLGPEHPDTLTSVNNLASVVDSRGDYAAAEPLYRRALEAGERLLGAEHPTTLTSLNNLAVLLYSRGDYAAAEPLCRRTLEAWERLLGPEHPTTLTSLNNLALLLESKGDYAAAEPLFRRALEAKERVLGPEHPGTLTSVNNLASLLESKGDYAAAEPLYRRALEASQRVLGPQHPLTLARISNLTRLANALESKGAYAAAEPLYRLVLDAKGKTGETEQPQLAIDLNQYALLLRRLKRFDEAAPYLQRAIGSEDRLLPPDHPKRAHRRNNLAIVCLLAGQLEEARHINAEAWSLKVGQHDVTSGRILFCRIALAWLRNTDAAPYLGQLRSLLAQPELPCLGGIDAQWAATDILDHLRSRLTPEKSDLLAAIVAALNEPAKAADLERFDLWRSTPAVPLDSPWPDAPEAGSRSLPV